MPLRMSLSLKCWFWKTSDRGRKRQRVERDVQHIATVCHFFPQTFVSVGVVDSCSVLSV